jgi:hypothetical protein
MNKIWVSRCLCGNISMAGDQITMIYESTQHVKHLDGNTRHYGHPEVRFGVYEGPINSSIVDKIRENGSLIDDYVGVIGDIRRRESR